MRLLRLLWWRVRYAVWQSGWRLSFWVADWRVVHGINIGIFDMWDGDAREQVFRKLEAALGLIAAHDPRRLRRAARDIRRVWARRAAYAAAFYVQAWDMCVLDHKFITDAGTTTSKLAAVFVHEATHARLFKRGIRYTEAARQRIEGICVSESAAFARRLPDGETLARYISSGQPVEASHWSDQNLNRRMLEAKLQEIEEASLPAWLKRVLRRVLMSRAA